MAIPPCSPNIIMAAPSRRDFLQSSAALGSLAATHTLAAAIEPVKRPGTRPDLRLALAAYSFHQALNLKKPTMSLFDFIDFAAELPLDAVELTSYFFAETSDAYLDRLKAHAAKKKLAISGVPVGNSFTIADETKRQAEVDKVKAWIVRAARLGASTVRIFAGNLEKGDTLEAAQKRVVAAIDACCETAARHNILLALENHGGITGSAEQLLALVKPVVSKHLGVNIDTGNFRTTDPYADIARIAPYGVVCQIKTEVFPAGKPKQEADLKKLIKILKDANFHGTVALEYEAAEDPKTAVPRHIKELRKLISA